MKLKAAGKHCARSCSELSTRPIFKYEKSSSLSKWFGHSRATFRINWIFRFRRRLLSDAAAWSPTYRYGRISDKVLSGSSCIQIAVSTESTGFGFRINSRTHSSGKANSYASKPPEYGRLDETPKQQQNQVKPSNQKLDFIAQHPRSFCQTV